MASSWTSLSDDEITSELVQKYLGSSQNDSWVVAACLDRILSDVGTQRSLLQIGLDRSGPAIARSRGAIAEMSAQQDLLKSLVTHFEKEPLDAQVCQMRGTLLDRLDRLNTYTELCKELLVEDMEDEIDEGWEDDPWAESEASHADNIFVQQQSTFPLPEYLTDDLLYVAVSLASRQQFGALRVLIERHGSYLLPYRFTILNSIPEHSHPSDFRELLPIYDFHTDTERQMIQKNWRSDQDWTETPEVRAAIRTVRPESHPLTPNRPEPCPELLSSSELLRWYRQRVDSIISVTGMVDIALALTQHGASSGLAGLDELGEELSLFSRLVYDAPGRNAVDNDYPLVEWQAMDPQKVICSYLAHSSPTTVVRDIQRLVIPHLFVLESRAERSGKPDASLRNRLLFDYVVNVPLEMAAAIFEASMPTIPIAQRLISDDEDLARLALASLYGSDSLNEWATMSRIFECLPAWGTTNVADSDEDDADTTIASLGAFVSPTTTKPLFTPSDLLLFFQPLHSSSLTRVLDVLDVHLESGEILSRWNVPAKLRWFLQSRNDEVEQRSWVRRMSRRAGGKSDEPDSIEEYEWLLEDMLKLSATGDGRLRGAFGLISRGEIISIFFSGLLNSGKFNIAKQMLRVPHSKISLDATTIEDICLSCSREFYDNASSGNYKFGEMNLAYNCLSVPPLSPRIVQEQEFIEATSRICSFKVMSHPGILISPIEIRLTKDRLSLVSRVLSNNDDAYKHTEVVLELVHKLGFKDDITAEVRTLAMISDVALQNEDFGRAYDINQRIVQTVLKLDEKDMDARKVKDVCWVACFQLGRQSEFPDVQKKLSLLGRSLELCPSDRMVEILGAWRKLDHEDVYTRKEASAARSKHRTVRKRLSASTMFFNDRLQIHMPPSPLVNVPDAATLASNALSRVAANFPFSVRDRDRSPVLGSSLLSKSRSQSRVREEGEDRIPASRVLQKGIGWLIGADD